MTLSQILSAIDDFVWGPAMLILLMGTGIYLTFKTHFIAWRRLIPALKLTLSKESRTTKNGTGDISPFAALTTALAATIGTGNIVGVATAMVAGGPGALVWMWVSAAFGMTTKFSECMLAIKYREINSKGEICGGPMYTMKNAFKGRWLGPFLGWLFALFTVLASFGIGNLTQGNSISNAMDIAFGVSPSITGLVITILAFAVIMGGIKNIAKVSRTIVPLMAFLYIALGLIVIFGNIANLPAGIATILKMAFSIHAVGGGLCGSITASIISSMRFGVSRGCFSNEAGMGSAAITAAAATTDNPVQQGYVNMTGTFWDTIVVCTITGLCICCSGMLGQIDPATGSLYTGVALTMASFETVLGSLGSWSVCVGIVLFAFSTILGWEYQGEKALEYLVGTRKSTYIYRIVFSLAVYIGATTALQTVWSFSDIANALMCIPNLICLLVLSKEIAAEIKEH